MPIVAEGTLGVLEIDNDVGGDLFGNCRVRATSDVGEVRAVLELTTRSRQMLDALPVSDVIAGAVPIGFATENLRVNMLLHGAADTLSVGDSGHLTLGTVRIFPGLRSCAA
jgi:hypothetical protein